MGTDLYLIEMYRWLLRIGYRPYFSGIGLNAECPNLLIRDRLKKTIELARRETGRRVHLVGHSLGGLLARSIVAQRPGDVASVITLASPFRGPVEFTPILQIAELVRKHILLESGPDVLPDCYTGGCTCDFMDRLRRGLPSTVAETAIYSRSDRVVNWRFCVASDPADNFEVPGTHPGLAFNPVAYGVIATRLADAGRRGSGGAPARKRARRQPHSRGH
jgi:pimeloyl-ACP methyl ester carboxylesterase